MYTVLETAVNGQSLCTDGEPSPPSPVSGAAWLAGATASTEESAVESRDARSCTTRRVLHPREQALHRAAAHWHTEQRPASLTQGFSSPLSRVSLPRPSIGLAVFIAHVVRAPVAARKQEW